jgi:hypothetical protein
MGIISSGRHQHHPEVGFRSIQRCITLVSPTPQVEGDVVATATYTLKCRFQTFIQLPPEFGAVQMVMVTSSGGTPGPYIGIPSDEVRIPFCSGSAVS